MTQTAQPDHLELHRRVLHSDDRAQAELFEDLFPAIRRLARRTVHCDHLAADVAQDVFVTYFRRPERYDAARAPLRSYLATIARRRAIDVVRSREAERRRDRRIAAELPRHDDAGTAIEALVTRIDLDRALQALPESQRLVLGQAYGLGRSRSDIAHDLDVAEGTVKSRVRLAKERLRRAPALAR